MGILGQDGTHSLDSAHGVGLCTWVSVFPGCYATVFYLEHPHRVLASLHLSVTSCPLPACSSLPHLKPDLIQLEPVHPSTPLTFHSHTWNPHTAFVWVSGVAALEPQLA